MSVWGAVTAGRGVHAGEVSLAGVRRPLVRATIPTNAPVGTAFFSDRVRAKAAGDPLHFLFGLGFALAYYGIFEAIDEASWWLGALIGAGHAVFAGTAPVNVLLLVVHPWMGTRTAAADASPLLEPPGFLLLTYGASTPLVTVLVHLAYGAVVGQFVAMSS